MLVDELVRLHVKYNVYLESQMNGEVQDNLVVDIEEIEELRYLSYFYYQYFEDYLFRKNDGSFNYFKGDFRPRSINLPFLGTQTIAKGKSSHFFVFKGSLVERDQLSITELSCFWQFEEVDFLKDLYKKYDPNLIHSQPFIHHLWVNEEITDNSYVADLYRVTDGKGRVDHLRSKQLIMDEIQLLEPEVVVLIGSDVRKAFEEEISAYPERFIFIPYKFRGDQEPYDCLKNRLANHKIIEIAG